MAAFGHTKIDDLRLTLARERTLAQVFIIVGSDSSNDNVLSLID